MAMSARLMRPLMRAQFGTAFRTLKTQAPVTTQLQKSPIKAQQSQQMSTKMLLLAAMPQLVPFYWVNEVATTFVVLPTIIYLMSKYWLPQVVRTKMARLFISKL